MPQNSNLSSALPLIPALNLKATLGQKPQNQLQYPLIILKKSPAIIVTGNTNKHGIKLRQGFERTVPKLQAAQRGRRTKGGAVAARKAARRLKTIAGQVVRKLDAALLEETKDRRWLETAMRVLNQKRKDGDKIYSLHEPDVYCMIKSMEQKKYEFGAGPRWWLEKTTA